MKNLRFLIITLALSPAFLALAYDGDDFREEMRGRMHERMRSMGKHILMGKHIGKFLVAVQGESITLPPQLVEKLLRIKARKFELAAQGVERVSEQFKRPEEKAAYHKVASQLRDLATSIRQLPIPEEGLRKSFEMLPAWMKLKAAKKILIAKILFRLADRIEDEQRKRAILHAAIFMKHHAKALKAAIKHLKSMEEEEDMDEGMTESEEEE